MDLETRLQDRLAKATKQHRSTQKDRYQLSKALGFTPTEAMVLQNWSEEKIKDLARQRGYFIESATESPPSPKNKKG